MLCLFFLLFGFLGGFSFGLSLYSLSYLLIPGFFFSIFGCSFLFLPLGFGLSYLFSLYLLRFHSRLLLLSSNFSLSFSLFGLPLSFSLSLSNFCLSDSFILHLGVSFPLSFNIGSPCFCLSLSLDLSIDLRLSLVLLLLCLANLFLLGSLCKFLGIQEV